MLSLVPTDDELANVPILDGLSRRQREWVSRLSTPVDVAAGRVLAHQGAIGSQFFIVIDGIVEVVQDRELVATRGPGSPLGEIALLTARRRTATLIAQTPVRARVAGRGEFAGLLSEVPAIAERLHATMAERLAS